MILVIFGLNLLFLDIIWIPVIYTENIYFDKRGNITDFSSHKLNDEIVSQTKQSSERKTSTKIGKEVADRRSRQQYEIFNMLWLKTNVICFDMEFTTENSLIIVHTPAENSDHQQKIINRYQRDNYSKDYFRNPKDSSSKPSYIEFYYLGDTADMPKTKFKTLSHNNIKVDSRLNKNKNHLRLLSDSPIFALRLNEDNDKILPTEVYTPNFIEQNEVKNEDPTISENNDMDKISKLSTITPGTEIKDNHITFKTSISPIGQNFYTTPSKRREKFNKYNVTTRTTLYDKIKFFEMYDRHTRNPLLNSMRLRDLATSQHLNEGNKVEEQKVLLHHIDQNIEQIDRNKLKSKFVKKHIIEENEIEDFNKNVTSKIESQNIKQNTALLQDVEFDKNTNVISNQHDITSPLDTKMSFYFRNRTAAWAEYPFSALYVYETKKVRCDAAAISLHWLIAAGSCLYRHRKVHDDDGRSAYITYCGETWWTPERVAYVKDCFVHPGYHPYQETRRHLYNIGVIRVVTSMGSCTGWAPISLMSHQFSAGTEGSVATAVGWGMDRFDSIYAMSDLPKTPLTVYKAMVYTESCPGNIGYSKAKYDDEGSARNVYCLSLPPYFGEENDLVHGGILLSGGKLIALYLQEERRPWGAQSAQYTGTWQLIPWVLEVASEPDDLDAFTVEI